MNVVQNLFYVLLLNGQYNTVFAQLVHVRLSSLLAVKYLLVDLIKY